MIAMRIEGGQKLAATLRALPLRQQRGILNTMLKKSAEPMRERIAQLAPVEPGAPDLAEHIAISASRKKEDRTEDYGAAVVVGPERPFFYGYFQEWGTVHHSAHPFMRPGFDETTGLVITALQLEIWANLRKHTDRSLTGRNL